jgi:enoyl-CoA hydratase/carnithine racemase
MEAALAEFVRLEVEDGIGTIRLDRPPMNALNRQVQTELQAAAKEAAERPDVYAVIVYGGEKVFAAGADVKEFAQISHAEMTLRAKGLSDALGALSTVPKPTVAAITGYALGGGFEVALGCDRRIAGDNLLYTGRFVGAQEALEIGMVDQVAAPDDVYAAAVRWARQFVNGPVLALAATKAAVDGGLDTDLESGLKLESHLFAALFATEDKKAGVESFIENGPGKAKFSGN